MKAPAIDGSGRVVFDVEPEDEGPDTLQVYEVEGSQRDAVGPLCGLIPNRPDAILAGQVPKDTQISVRLEAELVESADALAAKIGGITTRAAILREAVKEGLIVLADRYEVLPPSGTTAPTTKKGKASKATRR